MNYRLLLVHAHPDDESSQSAATIARYCDAGFHVTLVTCTLGELGEILPPDMHNLTPAQLGQVRIAELRKALSTLGLSDHVFLGGAGRYHDSGMSRDEEGNVVLPDDIPENAFWKADLLEAADHLVEVIRSRRPHVISTYNPTGGYGHPDHIQAHRVTMYAVMLAGAPAHRPDLGEPWSVPRVVWSVYNIRAWETGYDFVAKRFPGLFDEVHARRMSKAVDREKIAVVVPAGENLPRMCAALGSHASQVDVRDPFWQVHSHINSLKEGGDAYVFVSGVPFPPTDSPHQCVFAGLEP